jgi:endonuclease YncB( thermonuclease family)
MEQVERLATVRGHGGGRREERGVHREWRREAASCGVRRARRRRFITIAMGVAVLVGTAAAAVAQRSPTCVVVAVDDAATWRLACSGGPHTLRFAGVRAPRPGAALERGEPYGSQARDLVRGWFVGRAVEVGGGTAWLQGEDLRRGLLALGLVELAAPAAGFDAALRAAEREARLGGRGLWSYESWRRHQASVREPLAVPAAPPLPAPEPLGAIAARLSRRSAAERRAAFDAAVSEIGAHPQPRESGNVGSSGDDAQDASRQPDTPRRRRGRGSRADRDAGSPHPEDEQR